MKMVLSSRALFVLGFVLLAATNIVVLSGVAYNRGGIPEALIILTERELQLPSMVHEENSGLALRLAWRALGRVEDYSYNDDWRSPLWFDAEKVKELGFTVNNAPDSGDTERYYQKQLPKEVFIVLEYNGESYREVLQRAELALEEAKDLYVLDRENKKLRDSFKTAEKNLARERIMKTRLFAIDAGRDPQKLREKYPDRTRFIIARGVVRPKYIGENKTKKVAGHITGLSIEKIHVPLRHRQVFDAVLKESRIPEENGIRAPRYQVELAYGGRLEPWLVSVRHMGQNSE